MGYTIPIDKKNVIFIKADENHLNFENVDYPLFQKVLDVLAREGRSYSNAGFISTDRKLTEFDIAVRQFDKEMRQVYIAKNKEVLKKKRKGKKFLKKLFKNYIKKNSKNSKKLKEIWEETMKYY